MTDFLEDHSGHGRMIVPHRKRVVGGGKNVAYNGRKMTIYHGNVFGITLNLFDDNLMDYFFV